MDRSVDASSAEERFVGGVYDGVDVLGGDVPDHQLDAVVMVCGTHRFAFPSKNFSDTGLVEPKCIGP